MMMVMMKCKTITSRIRYTACTVRLNLVRRRRRRRTEVRPRQPLWDRTACNYKNSTCSKLGVIVLSWRGCPAPSQPPFLPSPALKALWSSLSLSLTSLLSLSLLHSSGFPLPPSICPFHHNHCSHVFLSSFCAVAFYVDVVITRKHKLG